MSFTKEKSAGKREIPPYLETPTGIFTVGGVWFFTTKSALKEFAGEVLEKYPLENLIGEAELWVRSTDKAGILAGMLILLIFDWWLAFPLALLAGYFWYISKSGLISNWLGSLIRFFDHDFVIVTAAVVPLSWFGIQEMYGHLAAGFLLFFIFKFGWFRQFADKMQRSDKQKPTLNDRILKMVIVKKALADGISLKETEEMEKNLTAAIEKTREQHKSALSRVKGKKK